MEKNIVTYSNTTLKDILVLAMKGFDISFLHGYSNKTFISAHYSEKGVKKLMYYGDNIEHAIAACDMYYESLM